MFTHFIPTKVIGGRGCVRAHAEEMKNLGCHAFIVTGKSSAKCGALADMVAALIANGQAYTLFDEVMPNPTLDCVLEGTERLKKAGADFVVGIGGGSPMDAAKAIATLAVQSRAREDVLAGGYEAKALPMAHVPTTAGTGSEVTPYAIITDDARETKTSIMSAAMFPRIAYLDGSYMDALPHAITVNTVLDAFSHAVEGMLSRQATPLSDLHAVEAIRLMYPLFARMYTDSLRPEDRDTLLYASTLAGITIAQSGTTAVHGMGYALTYFHNIDHGRANALLLGETLKLVHEKNVEALDRILSACGCSLDELVDMIDLLIGKREVLPQPLLKEYAKRAQQGKNIKKSVYEPTLSEIERIYLRSCGK